MKTDLRPDAATIKRYSSPCLYTVFNEWSHYSAREGRSEQRKCVNASFSLPFPSFPAHCLSHLSPASWWHKEASVEAEVANDVWFGKEISNIANDWKKTHKRFGFMTLLRCEKKPLRGEIYDDIIMLSSLGPNVVVNFKFKEWMELQKEWTTPNHKQFYS